MNNPLPQDKILASIPDNLSRRRFLKGLAGASLLALGPSVIGQAAYRMPLSARTLSLEHHHTGDTLSLTYFENGRYVPEALKEASHFLRDYHNGQIHAIDPKLLDQLHEVRLLLGTKKPFQVLSAYRSPATNANLRRHTRGVATHSLHMEARAIDIRMEGISAKTIRAAALRLNQGGVGYYPSHNFVHLDTGEQRTWHR